MRALVGLYFAVEIFHRKEDKVLIISITFKECLCLKENKTDIIKPLIKVFLLKSVEGKIELFEYYIRVEDNQGRELTLKKEGNKEIILDFDGTKIETEVLALKDRKEYLKFSTPKFLFSFKNVMSKYISDYPALAKKVKSKAKGFRILAVLKIVNEYNAHFR